ncbi:nucleolar protein 8 [Ixodes scapularis]
MKKRLFVGNLSSTVKQDELREKFERFGHVENVEVHTKRDECGNPFKTFAYLDMELGQENLVSCIKTYHGAKWKGSEMLVQVAKESYIQRIQREAKSLQQKKEESSAATLSQHCQANDSGIVHPVHVKVENIEEKFRRLAGQPERVAKPMPPGAKKRLAASSATDFAKAKASLFEDDEAAHTPPSSGFGGLRRTPDASASRDGVGPDGGGGDPRGWSSGGVVSFWEASGRPSGEEKHQADNAKRLASLERRVAQARSQKELLRSALTSVDAAAQKNNRKTLFEDSDEEEGNRHRTTGPLAAARTPPLTKFSLFEEDSGEEPADEVEQLERDFRLRPHFEGKKGQKVLALQSRIGTDERFRLNERFLESDEDGDDSHDEEVNSAEVGDERSRNLNILRDVLGGQLGEGPKTRPKPVFKDTSRLRFDPAKEASSKFVVKSDALPKPKKKKGAEQAPETAPPPEVSGEQFYEVSGALKSALDVGRAQGAEGFSFSHLFERKLGNGVVDPFAENERTEGVEEEEYRDTVKSVDKSRLKVNPWEQTPFEHDSSEEEEDGVGTEGAAFAAKAGRQPLPQSNDAVIKEVDDERFGTEVDRPLFFFVPGDRRLLEGARFFRCRSDPDTIRENWQATKAKLLPIMMSKRKLARRAAERKFGKKKANWRLGKLKKK